MELDALVVVDVDILPLRGGEHLVTVQHLHVPDALLGCGQIGSKGVKVGLREYPKSPPVKRT